MFDACKQLKSNKASAYDMIKAAFPVMKEIVVKVFNILLKAGQFPTSWTEVMYPYIKRQLCRF